MAKKAKLADEATCKAGPIKLSPPVQPELMSPELIVVSLIKARSKTEGPMLVKEDGDGGTTRSSSQCRVHTSGNQNLSNRALRRIFGIGSSESFAPRSAARSLHLAVLCCTLHFWMAESECRDEYSITTWSARLRLATVETPRSMTPPSAFAAIGASCNPELCDAAVGGGRDAGWWPGCR
ncbi:hypothetical protein L1887_55075 [Cichorium endivia]|nr:hypothetical protein L1887_55075 [Cichorium endivia]